MGIPTVVYVQSVFFPQRAQKMLLSNVCGRCMSLWGTVCDQIRHSAGKPRMRWETLRS